MTTGKTLISNDGKRFLVNNGMLIVGIVKEILPPPVIANPTLQPNDAVVPYQSYYGRIPYGTLPSWGHASGYLDSFDVVPPSNWASNFSTFTNFTQRRVVMLRNGGTLYGTTTVSQQISSISSTKTYTIQAMVRTFSGTPRIRIDVLNAQTMLPLNSLTTFTKSTWGYETVTFSGVSSGTVELRISNVGPSDGSTADSRFWLQQVNIIVQ